MNSFTGLKTNGTTNAINTQCEDLESRHVDTDLHGSKLGPRIHVFNFSLNGMKPIQLIGDTSCLVFWDILISEVSRIYL